MYYTFTPVWSDLLGKDEQVQADSKYFRVNSCSIAYIGPMHDTTVGCRPSKNGVGLFLSVVDGVTYSFSAFCAP